MPLLVSVGCKQYFNKNWSCTKYIDLISFCIWYESLYYPTLQSSNKPMFAVVTSKIFPSIKELTMLSPVLTATKIVKINLLQLNYFLSFNDNLKGYITLKLCLFILQLKLFGSLIYNDRSNHLSVKHATRIIKVPARDITYQSTVLIVKIEVHILSCLRMRWRSNCWISFLPL